MLCAQDPRESQQQHCMQLETIPKIIIFLVLSFRSWEAGNWEASLPAFVYRLGAWSALVRCEKQGRPQPHAREARQHPDPYGCRTMSHHQAYVQAGAPEYRKHGMQYTVSNMPVPRGRHFCKRPMIMGGARAGAASGAPPCHVRYGAIPFCCAVLYYVCNCHATSVHAVCTRSALSRGCWPLDQGRRCVEGVWRPGIIT